MGRRICSTRDRDSSDSPCQARPRYSKSKPGIRKPRSASPNLRKRDPGPPCASKVSNKSTDTSEPPTRVAALARLVAAAARYAKISHTPNSVAEVTELPPTPTFGFQTVTAITAQIYRDIDHAWRSGMADIHVQLASVAKTSRQSRGGKQLTSSLRHEAKCVQRVIEHAVLGFGSASREPDRTSPITRLSLKSRSRELQSKVVAFEDKVCRRYAAAASIHGWMMLSVLAYSKSFRTACREVEESVWNQLMESIGQNYVSLELFFKVRGLDWMTPLNQLGNSFSPDTVVSYVEQQKPRELPAEMFQKPHSYVVPNCDGLLHRPNYQGRLQMDIPSSTHDSQVFRQDPSLRGPHTGNCNFCGRQSCNCEPFSSENVSRPLAELIHCSAQKGVGVRSLQTIKKDDILDEYVGELKPANYVDDPTYALELEQLSNGMQIDNPTLIDAQVYGNWTRYINASCHPSLKFVPAAVGKRHRMLVVATRDIDVFEELTIGYGDGYWLESDTRMCECNEPNCRYADLDSKDKVKMMVDVPNNGMDIDEDDERMDEDL